ncbi:hypothetical protein DFH07DRAFT_951240 [Mycena maculata]|uniref:Uncharacterized protein n=1 Tax=Mycena maculata TaxID=230809 RepID=A0AAD7K5P4_9AGAR|nr:hypothetical protein DFH07DRAFT_951240 [Mycena maculata]
MIPITLFGIVPAPLTSIRNLPHLDETNKPDRPLPAGRITLQDALILRSTLMSMCWVLSLTYSKEVMYSSMALSALTTTYNELRGSGAHFTSKYALNGLGLASFEAGTTLVTRNDKSLDTAGWLVDTAGWLAIFLSGRIFATTIYAQDFRDGPCCFAGVAGWSTGLSFIWNLDIYSAVAFTALVAYTLDA